MRWSFNLKPQIAPHIAYQGDLGISTSARKELDEIFAGTRDCREKRKRYKPSRSF